MRTEQNESKKTTSFNVINLSVCHETDSKINVQLINAVRTQLRDLSAKVHTTIQAVFVSRKIKKDLGILEKKANIVNQQCVVYIFKCDLCDAGYVGYTKGHLHLHIEGHSSVARHCLEKRRSIPKDLLRCFSMLKKCKNKFDCLVYEMLFIKDLKPLLNIQSDSIRIKVFL